MAATPQQMHELAKVILNVLHENLPISEEERRKLIQNKEALVNLPSPDIPTRQRNKPLYKRVVLLFTIY